MAEGSVHKGWQEYMQFIMAIGVMKAIRQLALRCPQDVALAKFDDLALSEVQPTLTAVEQPAYEIGYRGAELLMQRIESARENGNQFSTSKYCASDRTEGARLDLSETVKAP